MAAGYLRLYRSPCPQILNSCGVKYLVTQKIFWSYNEGEQFPYHYFYWEGMDGSKVVSFLPTSYTYRTDPTELAKVWNERSQKRDLDAFLLPFGYGDGGGGPARDYIEYALREENLEGCPRVKLEGPKEFFDDMQAEGGPKHTYTGELYFSAHRGTYTSQAMVKRNNRKSRTGLKGAGDVGFSGDAQGDRNIRWRRRTPSGRKCCSAPVPRYPAAVLLSRGCTRKRKRRMKRFTKRPAP